MNKHWIIFLLLILPFTSFGQKKDSATISAWKLEAGYQNYRTLDKNVSPLIYSSNNGMVGFQYQKSKPKSMMQAGLSFSIGSNQAKRFGKREATAPDPYDVHGERDSTVYEINPGLSFVQGSLYFAQLWKLNNTWKTMHLGGIIQNNFTYSALGADTWFFNQISLLPAFQIELLQKQKSQLNGFVSTPIVSYLVRQPYTLDPSLPLDSYFVAYLQTGDFVATLNQFQQVNVKLNYDYQLNNGKQAGISYQFSWMNVANIPDRNLKTYSHSFLLTYTF